jgi:glycolate dehydrogenase FAD-binding subunit
MMPANESELTDIIAGAEGALAVQGGGSRGIQLAGQELSTRGLCGIALYEPGALTLVAQAGTPLQEIEAMLAAEGQRLAFEPTDMRGLLGVSGEPTIGGAVAVNSSGPRRVQAGACRDFLLGVRFVDGRGVVVKNGGRVMKNVTGYDLVKLMAGAHGTLGVLSEVSLKVLPKPEMAACVLIEGLSDGAAVQAMSAALGAPYDVTGAAHLPVGVDGAPVTMIRLEGFEDSVRYRAGRLAELLAAVAGGAGGVSVETDQARVAAGWRYIRDVEAFHGKPGALWRLSVKPSDAPGIVAHLGAEGVVYDWGGGLIWLRLREGRDLRAELAAFPGASEGTSGRGLRGHATLVRGSGFARFHPEPAPLAAISRGLRAQFDPRGILNPGLMG